MSSASSCISKALNSPFHTWVKLCSVESSPTQKRAGMTGKVMESGGRKHVCQTLNVIMDGMLFNIPQHECIHVYRYQISLVVVYVESEYRDPSRTFIGP